LKRRNFPKPQWTVGISQARFSVNCSRYCTQFDNCTIINNNVSTVSISLYHHFFYVLNLFKWPKWRNCLLGFYHGNWIKVDSQVTFFRPENTQTICLDHLSPLYEILVNCQEMRNFSENSSSKTIRDLM
jgi:hypothetical protein